MFINGVTNHVKNVKPKKCKECDCDFYPFNTTQLVCGATCAIQYNRKKDEELAIKKAYGFGGRKKGKTKKECENDLRTRKKAAKSICHEYIRERDKFDPCICCGKPLGDNYQAGHYLESGNNPKIRYDEDNIHAQRLDCNFFKGGDSGFYRVNLIKKIGLEKVERLESMKGGSVKRTTKDYLEIERHYKEKLKGLDV